MNYFGNHLYEKFFIKATFSTPFTYRYCWNNQKILWLTNYLFIALPEELKWRWIMARKPLFIAFVGLAFASIACGITIDLPVDRIVTGPVQTEQILIEPPDFEEVNLRINFGAGKLQIRPGAGEALVNGTAEYNAPDLKPIIEVDGSEVKISTGNLKIEGIPNLGNDLENSWDLELGSQLMNLRNQCRGV